MSMKRVGVDPSYIELVKKVNGVTDRVSEVFQLNLKEVDVAKKLDSVKVLYKKILAEASFKRGKFLDLLDEENTPENLRQREELEMNLKSLKLEEYKVYLEMLALFVELKLDSKTAADHPIAMIRSALKGDYDLSDII